MIVVDSLDQENDVITKSITPRGRLRFRQRLHRAQQEQNMLNNSDDIFQKRLRLQTN